MDKLVEYLVALAILAVAAPVIVWTVRNRRSIRRGAALGALFLGLGHVIDPPQQQMLAATDQQKKKGSPENDEPLDGEPADRD